MKILIATHGKMADGVKSTLGLFLNNENIQCVNAYIDDHDYQEDLLSFIDSVEDSDTGIIFTDMIAGSVNQKVMLLNKKDNIKVISGFNVPLIMEIILSDLKTDEEIENAIIQAREQMQLVKIVSSKEETEDSFLD